MNSGEVPPSASDARSGGQAGDEQLERAPGGDREAPDAPAIARRAPDQAQHALALEADPPGGENGPQRPPGPGVLARLTEFSPEELSALPREQLEDLHRTIAAHREVVSATKLDHYRPYEKQQEFHAAGAGYRERAILGANQIGKTTPASAEVAMHLTRRYPRWWRGRRYDRPVSVIVGSKSGALVRDGAQKHLLGEPGNREAFGTGMVPRATIGDWRAARGVPNGVDTVAVRSGEAWSTLKFKSYDQGRENWQADTIDVLWDDEEPPEEIYTEGLTRLASKDDGCAMLTATPLQGMSRVVMRFLQALDRAMRHTTTIGLNDVPDWVMSAQRKQEQLLTYPEHERKPRLWGIPSLGSGAIFPVDEALIKVDPFKIPGSWPVLGALDYGYDHPFAAVLLAHDKDADVIYVTRAHRVRQQTPPLHALAIKPWGEGLRWAWPHDGMSSSKDSGTPLRDTYKTQGLRMLDTHAAFPDGSIGVEAGLMLMLGRMEIGKFKVFSNLTDWWQEFRLYRREEGKVVKEDDDLMAATRYGVVMIRFARPLILPPSTVGSGAGLGDYDPFNW